jgi:Uma2 family endonuclease
VPTIVRAMTADELLTMPQDHNRHELVQGELRTMTPTGHEHGRIVVRLAWRLARFVEEHDLGVVYAAETGFKIASDPDTVRAPNVAFISQARLDEVGQVRGYWPGAPDLVAEVVSPSDVYTEVEEKVLDWLEAGTRCVIVINPRSRAITVYRSLADILVLTDGDTLEAPEIVPGWSVPVRELFG